MAKDPAFLFYSSDFLTGTITMNNEQVGMYIKLLCIQHQKGKLTEKDMLNICKTYDEDVFNKFKKDENGLFYNERLSIEVQRRKQYSESRSNNRRAKNISKTYVPHMEAEAEAENVISIKNNRETVIVRGISNAETEILGNQIEFERICMATNKTIQQAKISLRKYHLHLEENDSYPRKRASIFSGFEKWLMNEKADYSNKPDDRFSKMTH